MTVTHVFAGLPTADPERAGDGLLTLIVGDLDSWLASLAGRGIEAPAVNTIASTVRRCEVQDPGGKRIQLAQMPGADE